jgi:uncharacterized membrane protein
MLLVLLDLALGVPHLLQGQDRRNEQFYYPGSFNWTFLKLYPEAARLFNAFDYGHAVLYERLLLLPAGERESALEKEYQFLTTDLLVRPPRFAIAEEVIEPVYAKLAWQAKQMFDWAHLLHRQIYDIYSDERLDDRSKNALIEKVTDYYLSRKDIAFTDVPKSMALMDDQYFSQVFRKRHVKFNGLIWSYHWLQVGLYEPLILGKTVTERKAGLKATLARFWSMLQDPPSRFPTVMPMTATVAPTFTAQHPRAAVIFDNLHMMHDIISDVLAADTIPRSRKREVIYQQLAEFRDRTHNVMSMDEWRGMGEMMGGIGAMGGPATGLLPPASPGGGMKGMDHAAPGPGKPAHDSMAPTPMAPGITHPMGGADSTVRKSLTGTAPGQGMDATMPAMKINARAPRRVPARTARFPDHGMPGLAGMSLAEPPVTSTNELAHPDVPPVTDSGAGAHHKEPESTEPSALFPMHSWHPVMVHVPLVTLLLAALLDGIAAWRREIRWRTGATLLWWVGLAGAAAAITTGLLAYGRVEHSNHAHEMMIQHRNLAFFAAGVLLAAAAWRWRRPLSRSAAIVGLLGALGLGAVGYLGGEIVYRHALGIPTEVLEGIVKERGGHVHDGTTKDTIHAEEPEHAH